MQRLLLLMFLLATGCGAETAADQAAPAQRVYWDSESRKPVVAEAAAETPAVNPATGRRTLMPALYCPVCGDWRAAPPLAEIQRNPRARTCATCKGPLDAEGPAPEATTGTPQK